MNIAGMSVNPVEIELPDGETMYAIDLVIQPPGERPLRMTMPIEVAPVFVAEFNLAMAQSLHAKATREGASKEKIAMLAEMIRLGEKIVESESSDVASTINEALAAFKRERGLH